MIHDPEFTELMQSLTQKSLHVMSELKNKSKQPTDAIQKYMELTEQFQNMTTAILHNPEKIWSMQVSYWTQAMSLAQNQFNHWLQGKPMPIADHRFSGEDWLNNPFFNQLSQQYTLASQEMDNLLNTMEFNDKQAAKKVRFFSRQYLDALSPANFIHTNPQIIAQTIESRGKNLVQGLNNLLADIDTNSASLNIKMTDTSAYMVGENLAITPGSVVFRNEMMELIQYTAQTEQTKTIPLLIIPPWINKYYILDLSPHNSLIRWLVSQGITVFIISWVNPDARFAKKELVDYMQDGPQTAIRVIKEQLQVKKVNTLGFCIGGTLLAALLAYNKAHDDDSINSATFLAAMIDFSDPGDIAVFIDEQQIQKLEKEMAVKGYLAGRFMASSFNSLRANDLIWSFFIKNYLQGKKPIPFDILYWNGDSTNMPATMHSQYLRWMYLHNDLIKPGKIKLNNTPIDVSAIDVPTFFLSTEKDHIAPWQTTYTGFEAMKGPKRFVLGGSGHIAGIINPPTAEKYGYKTNSSSTATAEQWFNEAKSHSGSWWPEWLKWLKPLSGKTIKAKELSTLPHKSLMAAPGSYVVMNNEEQS